MSGMVALSVAIVCQGVVIWMLQMRIKRLEGKMKQFTSPTPEAGHE